MSVTIQYFKDSAGRSPFLEWLEKLRDREGRAKVKVYLDRLARGNFGNSKSVGSGLHELRINFGPGYRVYFALIGQNAILILCGGSKQSQSGDIKRAKTYWAFIKDAFQ